MAFRIPFLKMILARKCIPYFREGSIHLQTETPGTRDSHLNPLQVKLSYQIVLFMYKIELIENKYTINPKHRNVLF